MYNFWLSERSSQNRDKVEKVKQDEIGRVPLRRGIDLKNNYLSSFYQINHRKTRKTSAQL